MIKSIKFWLNIIILIAFLLEMIFFPSFSNLLGSLMALISWIIYSFFLRKKIILQFPFAFLMFTSMFLNRYLPIIATLIEGKPVNFGMELPAETFFYEIILFPISALAFYYACLKRGFVKNSKITILLYKVNFFKVTSGTIWGLGFIGLLIRIYTLQYEYTEFSDVGGKFIIGLRYLLYSPIILLFPDLIDGLKYNSKKLVWAYLILISILNISTNSREEIISPIGVYILLFFLNSVKSNLKLSDIISPGKAIIIGLFLFFGLSILSDLSLAMIYNRRIRTELNKEQLFLETLNVYRNDEIMSALRTAADSKDSETTSYNLGWDETYIDNFMLNRYANMRINDQTLYYAKKRGFGDPEMIDYFIDRTIGLLPSPILSLFGISLNKESLNYSPGDILYGQYGGKRVASHVGTGLSTFSYWYFPIQFILFFLVFKLLNTFVFYSRNNEFLYAPFALINVFEFLGMFRNSAGSIKDLSFIIRGYLEGIVTYLIVFIVISFILSLFNKSRNINNLN